MLNTKNEPYRKLVLKYMQRDTPSSNQYTLYIQLVVVREEKAYRTGNQL